MKETVYFENPVFHSWVPRWVSILLLLVLFMPIMTCGSMYSSVSADTIGALQLWSEDFTFCSLCGMVGTCAAAPFFYKVSCIRRHRLMFLMGFGLWIILGEICLRTENIFLLCFCNIIFGALRLLLMSVNFATFARLLLKRDFRYMLGPEGDGRTTQQWDEVERAKSAMVPMANFYFMSIATLGIGLSSWFANWHIWSEVPRFWNMILAILMLLIFFLERPRGWKDVDESAMSPDDAPMIPDGRCPFLPWKLDGGLKYLPDITSICMVFGGAAYIFVYGETLDWFSSVYMWTALGVSILGILAFIGITLEREESDRYFRMELFQYKNVWIAIIIYTLANVLNTSSALTNVMASIGLQLDTLTQNQLTNWGPLGYLIGCILLVVLRMKFNVDYKWVMSFGFAIFGYSMWWTYNSIQLQTTYEDMVFITVVRNCAHFILYCICMIYAYQRLPYRLMPTWICLMIGGRSIIGPSIGASLYGCGLQYMQLQHLSNLTGTLAPDMSWDIGLKTSSLQSMLLAVKGLAGYTLWAVIIMIVILLIFIPWKKRRLKAYEIRDETIIPN
ncbi:MAG: hypothetical protein LUI04_03845 [Porphyromonadaceae bacterium]|nr:hypothetical protein [Porphyromonadaceae bacterium]